MMNFNEESEMINELISQQVIGQPEPVVDMGCTVLGYSDRSPATIVSVEKTKDSYLIGIEYDRYEFDHETQQYVYSRSNSGYVTYFKCKSLNDQWFNVVKNETTGRWLKRDYLKLRIGERDRYFDREF